MSEFEDQPQDCSSFKRPAREKVKPSTKSKKRKRLSLSLKDYSKARVNIGMAFNRWRALKATKGLKSDAEVALCLLDVMKRLPPTSAPTGDDGLKMQFSQSEVQALIKQEVCSAMQKNEARLQSLIETIQQLDNGVNYEMSIQKLEARIQRMSKKAEAALAYVTKTQMKGQTPSVVKEDISIESENETTETMSQNEKSVDLAAKPARLFQMMKTTKKALNKVNGFSAALTATTEDLRKKQPPPVFNSHDPLEFKKTIKREPKEIACNEELREHYPPVCGPNDSPECKGLVRVIKEEREDAQERESNNEQFEEPKAKKLKVECVSPGKTNSPRDTDRDTVQRGLLFPPLPPTVFPSVLSMEAALYSIPQRLEVQLALIKNPTSLSVLWKVAEEVPSPPPMDSYTIFLTMEKTKGSGVFPDWKVLGEVKAIELPMCVLIRKHKPGHKVCAAVVGKDVFGRYGPYSTVATAAIPD